MKSESKGYILFETDIAAYHLPYIREGIARHLSQSDSGIDYFPLGINHLVPILQKRPDKLAVIGMFDSEQSKEYIHELKIPFLDLTERTEPPEIGFRVGYRGEGRRAADFFIKDLGLKNLAYYGTSPDASHIRRAIEFEEAAAAHGVTARSHIDQRKRLARFFDLTPDYMRNRYAALSDFLHALEKPAGIFCANDELALIISNLCRHIGISVPRELSVVGIGSLHRGTGGWQESVSVIQLDHVRMGMVAARLMESYLLNGVAPESVFLRPENIIHRYTTLRRSIHDSLVRDAMAIIQANPGLTIDELCKTMEVSRRTLELHFQTAGGKSIRQCFESERFSRACDLLKSKIYNMESVASLSGFGSTWNMRRSFIRQTGLSPRQFARSGRAS